MDLNPVTFFGGAVLGKAFSTLYAGIDDLIAKNRMFRSLFKVIRSRLDTLKPLIIDMALSNEQLSYTNNDELRGLEKVLEVGERLVLKCSNVRLWDLYRKYKYATKLLAWEEELDRQLQLLQVQGIRNGKKTAVVVENIEVSVGSVKEGINQMSSTLGEVNQLMKVNFVVQDQPAESRPWCAVPELPEVIVGLVAPLKDLKTKLLANDGFSMLVLTAPGECGKTTLATNFCKDQEVRDKFGKNIFFVTVSKKYSFSFIVEQLYRHNGSQVPTFQNESAISFRNVGLRRCNETFSSFGVLDDAISYIFKNSIQVKILKKLSLLRCDTRIGSVTSVKLSHAIPNLEEMYIEGFLLVLLHGLRDLISITKLTYHQQVKCLNKPRVFISSGA
ncbi:hypothetical protein ACLB2K_062249 [Fragaria x ananassa]